MLSKDMTLASFSSDLASKKFELLASLACALKFLIPSLKLGMNYEAFISVVNKPTIRAMHVHLKQQ
jgi:hypothetical protein